MPSRLGVTEVIRRLLMVALLVVVFFLSAASVGYLSFRGHMVEVPKVVGKSESEATSELLGYGLRIKVSKSYNDKVEALAVVDQSPAAGTVVKTGQIVRVVISLGAQNQAKKIP